MRHVLMLLSCLLLSEALMLAASPVITMHFPFNGGVRLFRTIRFLRYLLRMRAVLRRLYFTRRFFGMVPLLLLGRNERPQHRKFLAMQNPCLKRLACEVFTKPEPKGIERNDIISSSGQDNDGLKIFYSFDAHERDGYCKQRYASCPLSSMQIIKGLLPAGGLQPSFDL